MSSNMYLPEARRNILEMLESAMSAWIVTMQEESFSAPWHEESLNLMLEATAVSVGKLLAKNPNGDALMRVFALNLLDTTKE